MLNIMPALGLLLLMPGPTNTLLLRSGVLSGFRHAWPLSLLECLAYLLQISFWGYLLGHIGDNAPWCLRLVQFASVCYLAKTSYLLWRKPDGKLSPPAEGRVSRLHFFLLTLINPKGLLVVSFIVPVQTFTDPGLPAFCRAVHRRGDPGGVCLGAVRRPDQAQRPCLADAPRHQPHGLGGHLLLRGGHPLATGGFPDQ